MSPTLEFIARIADLERQLAEAKAILSDLPDHSDLDAAVFEANALRRPLKEAQVAYGNACDALRISREAHALGLREQDVALEEKP